jgi:hypothetical protein
MIKNPKKLHEFETNFVRKEPVDVHKNFRIMTALLEEAIALGVFPLKNPLEGIEIDIKYAKVINSVSDST